MAAKRGRTDGLQATKYDATQGVLFHQMPAENAETPPNTAMTHETDGEAPSAPSRINTHIETRIAEYEADALGEMRETRLSLKLSLV